MTMPPGDLRARVLAAAAATPSRTRAQGRRAKIVAAGAAVAVGLSIFEYMGGFAHSAGRPLSMTWALATGWAAFAIALTWLTVGRSGSTLARRPALLAGAALTAPLACFAWMHGFADLYIEPYERVGYRCLVLTLAMAALPLAAFVVLRRAVEPRTPSALGAAAGVTFGAWAGVLVDLWCPLTNASHVLVGHVSPLVLLLVVGALAGHRMLGVRPLRTSR